MKNYGAQRGKIREMFPEATEEEVTKINDAYYTAFPGVKAYHQYCYSRADYYSYTVNLFGVRYYGVSGHKLINLLVQGSAAYYLKWKMRLLYELKQSGKMKSRYILNIHDEVQYEWHKDEQPEILYLMKEIMEDWPDTKVPIVAEVEYTTTNWAEKKAVHSLEEWRQIRDGISKNETL